MPKDAVPPFARGPEFAGGEFLDRMELETFEAIAPAVILQ